MQPQVCTLLPFKALAVVPLCLPSLPSRPPLYQFTPGPWCTCFGPAGRPLLSLPVSVYRKRSRLSGPSSSASCKAFPALQLVKGHPFLSCLEFVPGVYHMPPFTVSLPTAFIDALPAPRLSRGIDMHRRLPAHCVTCSLAEALRASRGGAVSPFLQLHLVWTPALAEACAEC